MAGFKGSQSGFSWSKIVAWTAPGMYDGSSPIKVTLCDLWVSYQVTCEMAGGYFGLDDLHQSHGGLSASHRDARRAPGSAGKQVAGVGACPLRWSFAPWHEIFPA